MGKLNLQKNRIMLVEKTLPENLRKKTERDTALASKLRASREQRAKDVVAKKAEWLKRGQTHYTNYVNEQRRLVEARRNANANGEMFVEGQPKVLLVVRVKVNKATLNMLQRIQPYVTYGYPNRKTVESLVYKRGYGKVAGQRVRLSNNFIVEENLNKHGCMCMEDVVDQVMNVGPAFKQVNNFLWPFKLSSPKGGLVRKTKPFLSGGDFGSREHEINAFVRRMI